MANANAHQLSAIQQDVCRLTGCDPSVFDVCAQAATTALNADEVAVCHATGIAEADFLAARAATGSIVESAQVAGGTLALAACAFALQAGDGQTIRVQLTPAGDFRPSDGRSIPTGKWHIDQAVANRAIAAFRSRKTPNVVDYEHQTLHKEKNGQPAPAAGWFKDLEWHEGIGLFGLVQLTARAQRAIQDGEYRYVSPVFSYDESTGDVLDIKMAAITNTPAIDGMEPLARQAAATFGATG